MDDNLAGFDWSEFWDNSDYSLEEYVGAPVTPEMIQAVEEAYGYKLPQSYIKLLQAQNGGTPKNTACKTDKPTSWAEDHCAITAIFGVDPERKSSLLGTPFRSDFWIQEWGYPDIGLYICDCPSAGHDMIALDYSVCGNEGDPRVVHVDQEGDYEITVIAGDFAEFVRKLESDENFEFE